MINLWFFTNAKINKEFLEILVLSIDCSWLKSHLSLLERKYLYLLYIQEELKFKKKFLKFVFNVFSSTKWVNDEPFKLTSSP